jgi:hypothetical protein
MLSRYLAESTELIKTTDLGDAGFVLEYYITESSCEYEGASGQPIYGLEIVKRQGGSVENSSIEDYTLCRENAVLLAEKLCNNQVTPVGLIDVLSDLIGV